MFMTSQKAYHWFNRVSRSRLCMYPKSNKGKKTIILVNFTFVGDLGRVDPNEF
jgi:hypothetical protein